MRVPRMPTSTGRSRPASVSLANDHSSLSHDLPWCRFFGRQCHADRACWRLKLRGYRDHLAVPLGARLQQAHDLNFLRRHQAEIVLLAADFELRGRLQMGELSGQHRVAFLCGGEGHLAFLGLVTEAINLVFLPDVAQANPRDTRTGNQRSGHRAKPQRLTFTIPLHRTKSSWGPPPQAPRGVPTPNKSFRSSLRPPTTRCG